MNNHDPINFDEFENHLRSDDPEIVIAGLGLLNNEFDMADEQRINSFATQPSFDPKRFYRALVAAKYILEALNQQAEREKNRKLQALDREVEEKKHKGLLEDANQYWFDRMSKITDEAMNGPIGSKRALLNIMMIFRFAGARVSPPDDVIYNLLEKELDAHIAYDLLVNMGKDGTQFDDEIVRLAGKNSDSRLYDAAIATLPHSRSSIQKLLDKFWETLEQPGPNMIASIVADLGKYCLAVDATLPQELLQRTSKKNDIEVASCIIALSGITKGTDRAVQHLIDLARTGSNEIRGCAITALGRIGTRADLVVPVLMESLETFEEYHKDYMRAGEKSRVVYALTEFTRDAAPAVPKLIAHLVSRYPVTTNPDEEKDIRAFADEFCEGRFQLQCESISYPILDFLIKLGPAGNAAVPTLRRIIDNYDPEIADYSIESVQEVHDAINRS